MGGCGKTQLALNCCQHANKEKLFIAIYWPDASSPTSMANSFAKIAQTLLMLNFDGADEEGNIQFPLRQLQAWLL
jgi:hypothetical protein